MSTAFFRLNKPITHIRVESWGTTHTRLSVWVNRALSGILMMRNEELNVFLFLLTEDEECLKVCTGPHGRIITHDDFDIPDEAVVISEYGEVTTVGAVRESVPFSEHKRAESETLEKERAEIDSARRIVEITKLLEDVVGDFPAGISSNALKAALEFLHGDEAADWRDHQETVALPRAIQ